MHLSSRGLSALFVLFLDIFRCCLGPKYHSQAKHVWFKQTSAFLATSKSTAYTFKSPPPSIASMPFTLMPSSFCKCPQEPRADVLQR